jgi:hypothetical protein
MDEKDMEGMTSDHDHNLYTVVVDANYPYSVKSLKSKLLAKK